ncbi:RluA family pseudouridine synthase [Candidatus Wolfebacteria bacterium]|nr:RluA family pseudouridine synthase [Candidatus Wolfebacteria bacterium]
MEQIKVIYEDKNFLVVYKPAGVLTHPIYLTHNAKQETKNNKNRKLRVSENLIEWILKKYPEIKTVGDNPEIRPGIVHRLDKDTSGVILIARNQKAFNFFKKIFQDRKIEKKYLALVYGEVKPKTGIINKPIYLKPGTIKRTVWEGKMKKAAITEYKTLKNIKYHISDNKEQIFSLLELFLKTGRTHQIRVHLASIGNPIVADSLYAEKRNTFGLKRMFLHAESLEFSAEDGKRIKIEAELSEDLKNFLEYLGIKQF